MQGALVRRIPEPLRRPLGSTARGAALWLLLLAALLAGAAPAAAQLLDLPGSGAEAEPAQAPEPAGEGLGALIDRARQDGLRVIVVEPQAGASEAREAPQADPDLSDIVISVDSRARLLLGRAARDLERLPSRLSQRWPGEPVRGPLIALAWAALALALGRVAEQIARRAFGRPPEPPPPDASRGTRYAAILRGIGASLVGIVVQIAVALALFHLILDPGFADRTVGHAVILAGAVYLRVGTTLIRHCLRGMSEPLRLLPMPDGAARRLRRDTTVFVGYVAVALALGAAIERLGAGNALETVISVAIVLLGVLLALAVIWRNRHAVPAGAFRAPACVLVQGWPLILTAYFVGTSAVLALERLDGIEEQGTLILAPLYAAIPALVVYAVGVILSERGLGETVARASGTVPPGSAGDAGGASVPADAQAATAAGPGAAAPGAEGDIGPGSGGQDEEEEAPPSHAPVETGREIAATLAVGLWAALVLYGWGLPLLAGHGGLHNAWVILALVTVARAGWVLVRAFFDRRIAEEGGPAGHAEPGEEGGGAKGSRLGTLLPLFRTSVMVAVFALTAMIVLSMIGVDIAPLFAGAGLIGFAIGFGAQALVRDIFAGLFFLIDDAFRVGEYVEVGNLRGTVEKISIRSMQLRHHTGPLHTVPFGEIRELTNYSRDWVIMKLPLRVTFDTDPERVRKLVKKLGQELLEDPVHGSKFLAPLKSQGVREIDDSGQVIRVKFMTRPGEQFVLRKLVYAKIRELFEREGIEFARREVRVRVSDAEHPLTEAQKAEIAGAAAEGTLTPSSASAAR